MDVRMGGMSGLETLRRIRQIDSKLLVILMTAYGTTQTAIEAMKLGAYDYLLKPFDVPKLKEIVNNALKAARDMKQVVSYQPLLETEDYELGIVGRSEPMQQVFKLIGQLAASDATALITGESGTGKELVARAIYHHSNRSEQPFLAVNCAAIPEQLARKRIVRPRTRRVHRRHHAAHRQVRAMQSRHALPGRNRRHDAGDADKDPARAAIRHLRTRRRQSADQGRRADHRRDEQAAGAGGGGPAVPRRPVLPPQRGAHPYSAAARTTRGHSVAGELFPEEVRQRPAGRAALDRSGVLKALEKYHWPGNVRELENIIRRALVMAKGEAILLTDLPAGNQRTIFAAAPVARYRCRSGEAGAGDVTNLARQLFQWARREPKMKIIPAVERELVIQALKETDGNQVHAAKLLGITRATLRKRVEKFGIQRELNIK